ncbi:Succinylornithine transaminase [Leclercia adecarboxylata]|nr:Succinylornithine transaminase [Leclercia adecarboxylata]
MLTTDKFARVMTVGTHGTTYGGNPLASAVAGQVLDIINTPDVLTGVKQRHDWFVERLQAINSKTGLFKEIRGLGLLIGCVLTEEFAGKAKLISQEAAKAGVMVLIAGANVVRFAPALIVSEEEVQTGLDRFALACDRVKSGVSS